MRDYEAIVRRHTSVITRFAYYPSKVDIVWLVIASRTRH